MVAPADADEPVIGDPPEGAERDALLIRGAIERKDGADWTAVTAEEVLDAFVDLMEGRGWGFGGWIGWAKLEEFDA